MKFTCDKCGAQYMISDDKVGPSGVKVRCKKCSNVILVRRAVDGAAAAGAKGPGGEKGLDAELGQAFDHAFGDTPPVSAAPRNGASNKSAGKDLAATQMMGEEDAAKITAAAAAAAPAAPVATEWYVAIGQAQVGPLPAGEVKKKWEAGDVGPDSLVWRPGMGDWKPLSTVSDLATYLAPVPRPAPAARESPRAEAKPDGAAAAAAAAPEATWKPVGASALAALASEEIAARKSPEPRPQPSRPAPSGAKSLMDALPDGGGVDPTGAIPLSIKALETTGEKKIERRSSVARGVAEARHRRGVTRAVVLGVVTVLLIVGAAAGGVIWYMNEKLARAPVAAAPAPAIAPAPAPAPAAPRPAVAAAPAAVVQPPPPRPPEMPRATEPEPRKVAPEPKVARTEPARTHREPPPRTETKVAKTEPPPPPPEPPPEPKKKKGDLLDFEGNDSALDEALGNKPTGRSVYVPPARSGGSADLPNQLSPGDINASVAQRIDPLRKCVSDQKARDPTATGVLRMRWTIGGDGNVRDVKPLPGDYAQSPFAQCIAGVVRSIKFPRSRTTGQEVTFPFNF